MSLSIFLILLSLAVSIPPLSFYPQKCLTKKIGVDEYLRPDIESICLAYHHTNIDPTHLDSWKTRYTSSASTELVTIASLVSDPNHYHMKTLSVRGNVTQLELHVDDTGLFINFVFVLRDGTDTLVVFGKHDQTQGGIPITTDQTVEVTGIFWKDRFDHDYHFKNNLEVLTVTPYPPLSHEAT